ncbi:folylpolyglutamate synthase/dihydrofolate synthase family protein [uncultured Adlercreutzia sp.]|uniref:bifunctional folylpolyglutamate synthase/dihydrofolate synthase n=1 Tax=uncultured Adlercreutzia sp. TaxID=875803 RepID=UPI0026764BD2|nr:folylpolyglutamate synthase/dihydrofolate synthase family protein [uncultured Adlercreutzia sp.]
MPFDPVAWINTPRWQASRLGLERMIDLLDRMGRPQDALRFVHVAGTNGKGSTCAYLASILQAAGLRVGLFTSPYILRFEERIRVNGRDITEEELARAVAAVRPHTEAMEAACGDHPTEFELMAAVALEHFRAVACDIVVLEVGLGGRLDATNVIDAPEASVICRIGLDHTDLLGNTLAAIAGEKAGIVKPASPAVSWPQEPEAMAVVEATAAERGCTVTVPDFSRLAVEPLTWGAERGNGACGGDGVLVTASDDEGDGVSSDASGEAGESAAAPLCRRFTYRGRAFETGLLGSYQPFNAALALEVARVLRERGWDISAEAEVAGIAQARWPGRFEVVDVAPLTIIDGGHNIQGAQALAASLADLLGDARRGTVAFAMGVLADKDYKAMVRAVVPWAGSFHVYAPANPRALPAEELATCIREVLAEEGRVEAVPVCVHATPAGALTAARTDAASHADSVPAIGGAPDTSPRARIAVAFGTLYAIADLEKALICQ